MFHYLEVARWDLISHIGIARWGSKLIKGDRQMGSRISIVVKGGNRQMGSQWLRPKRINVKKEFQIDQVSTRSVSAVQTGLSL